ncbi:MAG: type II toxin-antitoxin system RelE/ParE family toxin [Candidatus Pacebacteria bacterium]|nr:type II toxin-antitoxin system RelE/ParE family toxin [Candidatus Paceibacterota bacterium]
MDVEFQDNKLQEFCEDFKKLKKHYGQIQAQEIIKRINELSSAESLFDISKLPQARLHPLKQNLQGFLAVDLKHPYRLILLPMDGEIKNYKSITKIKIIKIIDYH